MLTTVSGMDIDNERICRPYFRPLAHAAELNYVHGHLDIWYLEMDIHATGNDLGSTHDKKRHSVAKNGEAFRMRSHSEGCDQTIYPTSVTEKALAMTV